MRHGEAFDHDVCVAGAGPAGIAAALAAARLGARVLLVERDAGPGGNVTRALVHTICGLYLPSADRVARHAHAGIPREFADALADAGHAGDVEWARDAAFLPVDPGAFGQLAARLLDEAGVECRYGRSLDAVQAPRDDRHAFAVTTARDDGSPETRTAWTVVDTTGDATAASLAGARTETAGPARLQHASWIFRVDDVDTASFDAMENARVAAAVARAVRSGELDLGTPSLLMRRASRPGCVFVTMNLAKPADDSWDPLDAAAMRARFEAASHDAARLLPWLAATRPAFRRARLGALPERVGVRETRRVAGLERLSKDDVLGGRRRDDEACVSTWPVEVWSSHLRLEFHPVAGPSSIPLGCLVADHPSRRLAMAGRCASASHEALGAIRVVATSMATGEAAGAACAMAASAGSGLDAVDAARVRDAVATGLTTSRA